MMAISLWISLLYTVFLLPNVSAQVNGSWGAWGDWLPINCPVTCGGAQTIGRRTRECNNPRPSDGGLDCPGSNSTYALDTCGAEPCPVNGNWGFWSQWSVTPCSRTCDGGTYARERRRICDSPSPANGGLTCFGDGAQSERLPCNMDLCEVDGVWSNWNEWSNPTCPVTCEGPQVTRERRRSCNNPPAQNGGEPCPGTALDTSTFRCNPYSCPVDGVWSPWSDWTTGTCSRTCGGGTLVRTRTKQCNNPAPRDGGTYCPGPDTETESLDCNQNPCTVNGNWGYWSQWSETPCSTPCGGGTYERERRRVCDSPSPTNGGQLCFGESMQSERTPCNTDPCKVDGAWSPWNQWTTGTCSRTCGGGTSVRTRTKQCNSPAPRDGGAYCPGPDTETESANCNQTPCIVNGNWGYWSQWSETPCSTPCGGGTYERERRRVCDSPSPANGGQFCFGESMQTERTPCNTDPCKVCANYTAVIVLDGSESVMVENFLAVKLVIQNFIKQAISKNSFVKIGVVVFGDNVTQVIAPKSGVEALSTAVGDINYPNSGTATHLGLQAARELLLEENSENRRFMIVLTDGLSSQPKKTQTAADQAKTEGITIIVLGVSEFFTTFTAFLPKFNAELNSMASSGFLFTIKTFDLLSNVTSSILQQLCGSPVWSAWGPWSNSPCPVTCGTEAMRHSTRTRTCLPGPQSTSDCSAPASEEGVLSCGLTTECPGGIANYTYVIVGVTCGAVVLLVLVVFIMFICKIRSNGVEKKEGPPSVHTVPANKPAVYDNHVFSEVNEEKPGLKPCDPQYHEYIEPLETALM